MSATGLKVPDQPIIPFIEGDGTGPDIWKASVKVFDAAVEKAYGGKKKITWKEVLAGEKAFNATGNWLPDETLEAFKHYLVGIKGPLTTPIGGGIRSLNVALRQILDLFVCLRPVKYFKGVPSPVKKPEDVDMVIFRENTEDIYAGIEYAGGSDDAKKLLEFFKANYELAPPEVGRLLDSLVNLLARQDVGAFRAWAPVERAEAAVRDADVRRIQIAVDDVGDDRLGMLAPSHEVGELTQGEDVRPLVEEEGFLSVDSLAVLDPGSDACELRAVRPVPRGGRPRSRPSRHGGRGIRPGSRLGSVPGVHRGGF
jgi:hypothetical protein